MRADSLKHLSDAVTRVLIWGKTYPELSRRHVETVCTGGVLEDGSPVRLYPVPLRYLHDGGNYRLYDWIEVPLRKSTKDPRPESHRIVPDRIQLIGSIGTTLGWRDRRASVFKHSGWQFPSFDALRLARERNIASMGVVTPKEVLGVTIKPKPLKARDEHDQKLRDIQDQGDLFRQNYKALEFLPNRIMLTWRCADSGCTCADSPHEIQVLDWGLLELARREGWEKAQSHLATITNPATHEIRLFLGNYFRHQQHFGVIGLWYPLLKDVVEAPPRFL